jgi:hypothetical protein
MTDLSNAKSLSQAAIQQKPIYERPSLKVMREDEVLEAFQMTATEISAAGCWWSGC